MKKVLISLSLLLCCGVWSRSQGLKFHGLETSINERTSFEVFANSPQKFHGTLDISFQMATYPAFRYGYILRLHDTDTTSRVWNLSYDARGEKAVFRINEEGKKSIIYAEIDKNECPEYLWQNVRVRFSARDKSILLKIGKHEYSAPFPSRGDTIRPKLYFGRSEHVVDVPSFAIRNLSVSDGADKTIFFPLDESEGEKVHDSKGKVRGRVSNPDWLIRKSCSWNTEKTIQASSAAEVFYNEQKKEVGILTEKTLTRYSLTDSKVGDIVCPGVCPIDILLGHNFIHDGKIYAYELNHWMGEKNDCSIACFDLESLQWSSLGNSHMDSPQHHHGAFYNSVSDEYTFFGGFGGGLYNGDFYALGKDYNWYKKWPDRKNSRKLFPRFFASAGTDEANGLAYIFGGMGNESGEQVVGRRYFYDLHRIDLKTGKCELLWEIEPGEDNYVPARNLVVDGDYFYVLCYPEYLTNSVMHLYRFRISDGSYEILADGIDVVSDKIWSSSSLYLDRNLGEFVVTSLEVDDNLVPSVSIHTLMYPPVPEAVLKKMERRDTLVWSIASLLGMIAIVTAAAVFFRISARRKESKNYVIAQKDPKTRIFHTDSRSNAIFLFGRFTVIDRNGNDISDSFSNQQKTLLCLMLKYHENGLSSSRMTSLLWPDKEESKAKNSRGVAVNSLRKSLSALDGISVEYEDHAYKIITGEPFYCDLFSLNSRIKANDQSNIVNILSRGKFLKDITDPVFDGFKARIEDAALSHLSDEISKRFDCHEYRAAIEIGDIIQLYDPLDEQAIHYIVHSLMAIKRQDDALVHYSAFANEYQSTNGEPYPKHFDKV